MDIVSAVVTVCVARARLDQVGVTLPAHLKYASVGVVPTPSSGWCLVMLYCEPALLWL